MAARLATQAGGGHATGPAAGGAWLDLLLSAWHQPHVCQRGRVILSPPVMWLLSPLFSLTACFGDGRRLFGFALPSTIPPLGAMGVPWLLWGECARKRLCRTNKQALEKWIKQYLDLKKKKGKLLQPFQFHALIRQAVYLFNTFLYFWSCYHTKTSVTLPPLDSWVGKQVSRS